MRQITYREAISEAMVEILRRYPESYLFGVGVADSTGIFGTTLEASKEFGKSGRVFDTPLSENTLTGICVGSSMCGMKPILVHARNDFMLLTMDQIVNHAAKWNYMSGRKMTGPILIRSIIGKGWGQAAQHSQSLQSLFMHIPGLNVAMPSTPWDVNSVLLRSMEEDHPTICIEHKWLYDISGNVPNNCIRPFGQGWIRRQGTDITVVATSYLSTIVMDASKRLERDDIEIEVIDPVTVKPLGINLIESSVIKTGRLLIVDTGWATCGFASEVSALINEKCFGALKDPVKRITLPEVPTPCSPALEKEYYPDADRIVKTIRGMLS